MAIMPAEVQKMFNEAPAVFFGTADAQGNPNINIVGIKCVIDEETVYLSDQFFNKTLANLQVNPKVAISMLVEHDAYQIHGTASYVTEGAAFEEKKTWAEGLFAKIGLPFSPKGGCFVHVDSVYQGSSGPNAGAQIA